MRLFMRLLVVRYTIYAVLLTGAGLWALTSTELGQLAWNATVGAGRGFARTAPETAQRLAEDERFRRYAVQAQAAANITEDSLGVFADQANALAYASAATLPDPDELAAALEGWQTDLLEYEADLREELGDAATPEEIERRMDELFRPQTIARPLEPAPPPPVVEPAPEPPVAEPPVAEPPAVEPAPPAPEPAPDVVQPVSEPARMAAFEPHPVFYRCPVIDVSNSGPTAEDRTLTQYTPWIETPAGVLIRAPVAGACLSSGYGPRVVDGASKNHGGVDYYNRDGGAIFAAGDGVVLEAGEDEAYGYAVRIDHGQGVEGHYAHMVPGSLEVSTGDRVTLGQPIGVMGRSGRAYAVHLHYELRFAGTTVDPLYEGKRASY